VKNGKIIIFQFIPNFCLLFPKTLIHKLTYSIFPQVQLISDALPDFGVFHRAYMTGFFFPSVEDTRVMFTNGYYMPLDFELAEWFFDDFLPTEQIDNYLK
jgi:hypothetical protein